MSTHIPTTPTIYEFSTGIDIEWLPDNRWCSKGFTVAWRNNTFGNTYGQLGIPAGLDAAIRNRQFEVRAPEPEVAVVGRVVQHQGDPEIWAVVAVVSNALDKCGRGLPLWRYFCCACNDLTNANLELIRLLGRLDAFNATYGSLPAFDPQTLSGKQSDLDQIHPANRPTSEPKTPQYLDALNETNTVILPLVLDSGTCCSYHQLLALAATIACYQNRLMSWAWNVADVWDPEVFVVLQMAAGHQLYRISTPSVGVVDGHLSTSSSLQQPSPVQKKSSAIPPISALQNFEATLQQLSLESPVNPKTVAKLDQLLRQDPSINNPSVLRPIFKRLGVEANQRSFILYRDRLTEPEQVRLITFWPLLDPQMIPEYWKWCNAFSPKSEQRQISQTFQNEIKPIVSQFPTLEVSVGEDLVMRGFTLLQEGKISGTELAQQLTDTNSLFAPAPDVLCQTLGKRLAQVAKDCHLQIRGRLITPSVELVTDPYWTELNNYIRQWFLKKNDAARLGITHPLFVPQGSGGNGEALFSRGWNSWVNLREGFEKASEVFKLLGRLQQVLKALPTPIPCEKAYKELRAFLSVVCQKNALFSDFQPLQTFLNDALQPTTPVNRFELRVRVIGYILKPIVGLLLVFGIEVIVVLNVIRRVMFLIIFGILKGWVVVVIGLLCLLLWGTLLLKIQGKKSPWIEVVVGGLLAGLIIFQILLSRFQILPPAPSLENPGNEGGTTLIPRSEEFPKASIPFDLSNSNILALTRWTDADEEWQNMKSILERGGYTVNNTDSLNPETLSEIMDKNRVLLIPEQESGTSEDLQLLGLSLKESLSIFLQKGGIIISVGEDKNYSGFLSAAGLLNYTSAPGSSDCKTIQFNWLTYGVNENISAGNALSPINLSSEETASVSIITETGDAAVVFKTIASGVVIYLGWDYYDPHADAEKLLINAVEGSLRNYYQFQVGDRVRVKSEIETPKFAWGDVDPQEIGVIRELKFYESPDMIVDFPSQKSWSAVIEEMERVED